MLGDASINSNETLNKGANEQTLKTESEQKLKNSNQKRIQFYLDYETYEIIKALTLKLNFTVSDFIRYCIDKYLQQADPQKIQELKRFFEN